MSTPEQLFAEARATDAARPLVTFYDDETGERAELSAASLGNWVAKTHFLLTDELGLDVGARAYVSLPLHWMHVVVLFGAWTAGLEVVSATEGADAGFVTAQAVDTAAADEIFALALAPWGQGFTGAPPTGSTDFVAAVRPQADAWASVRSPGRPGDLALDGRTRAEVVESARARAAQLGLGAGARLLVGERPSGGVDVITLLAPFTVGGTLVLLRHAVPTPDDRRIAQENVTHVATW
ncbi:MAG: hypothetical protein JWM76_998 [Pseudonocardiales bacterium]|nr:hypothetical protein [Pseudonocardiales bacterium]